LREGGSDMASNLGEGPRNTDRPGDSAVL
jgi:hypothetical protein